MNMIALNSIADRFDVWFTKILFMIMGVDYVA